MFLGGVENVEAIGCGLDVRRVTFGEIKALFVHQITLKLQALGCSEQQRGKKEEQFHVVVHCSQ